MMASAQSAIRFRTGWTLCSCSLHPALQRRASYQTHNGRRSTLICCMFLSFSRIRLKGTFS